MVNNMNFVKVLSVTSVVLAALWLVSPTGKAANMFKYAMGLFVISVIISTLKVSSFKLPQNFPSANSEVTTSTAENLSNQAAAYVVGQLLKKCNINFGEIRITTDNSGESGINITKAYVKLSKEDFLVASEIIKNQTGIILVDGV